MTLFLSIVLGILVVILFTLTLLFGSVFYVHWSLLRSRDSTMPPSRRMTKWRRCAYLLSEEWWYTKRRWL